MKEISIYPTKDKTAVFECPSCKYSKTADISRYLDKNKLIKGKMKCKCGHSYIFILEKRMYFRKNVNLRGIFVVTTDLQSFEIYGNESKAKGVTLVEDISITGLKLKFSEKPNIGIGDSMFVEFHLDDYNRTLIQKQVVVRNIIGLKYGVEFVDKNIEDHINKKIGFYLFN